MKILFATIRQLTDTKVCDKALVPFWCLSALVAFFNFKFLLKMSIQKIRHYFISIT
jgi:hypothetical protein